MAGHHHAQQADPVAHPERERHAVCVVGFWHDKHDGLRAEHGHEEDRHVRDRPPGPGRQGRPLYLLVPRWQRGGDLGLHERPQRRHALECCRRPWHPLRPHGDAAASDHGHQLERVSPLQLRVLDCGPAAGPSASPNAHQNGGWVQNPASLGDQWAVVSYEAPYELGQGYLAPSGLILWTINDPQRRLLAHSYQTSSVYD